MGLVPATFKVLSDDAVPVPVDGVIVQIFDAGGTVFITEGTTGADIPGSGELILVLDGIGPGTIYTARLSKDGSSFIPSPNSNPTVYDPAGAPPNDNVFSYVAHAGLLGQLVTFAVTDDQAVPQPVEGVQFRVFDDSDTFLTEGATEVDGELEVVLPGAPDPGLEYIVRVFKAGVQFPGGVTQRVLVQDPVTPPATNIFDFQAVLPSTKVSSDPDLCLLSGYLVDAAMRPLRAMTLRFGLCETYLTSIGGLQQLSNPTMVRNQIIVEEALVQTDKEGYVEVALPRVSLYDFSIHGLEALGPNPVGQIYIPDLAGIDIQDVLFPYVTDVMYGQPDVTVAPGESVEVDLTILASNLQPGDLSAFLTFTSSDEAVAAVKVKNGVLVVTGVAAGSANIDVTRVTSSYVARRPDVAPLEVLPNPLPVTVI